MFTWQQLPSQHWRCSDDNSCHHSAGDVHTTTAVITAQEMSTQQQLPSQHRRFSQQLPSQHRCLHNKCHHSTGDVHMTTVSITAQDMFTWYKRISQHRRCPHNNSKPSWRWWYLIHKNWRIFCPLMKELLTWSRSLRICNFISNYQADYQPKHLARADQ